MNQSHPTYRSVVASPLEVDLRLLHVDQMTTIHGTRLISEVPLGGNLLLPSPPMLSTCPHENNVLATFLEAHPHFMLYKRAVIVKPRLHKLLLWVIIPTLHS